MTRNDAYWREVNPPKRYTDDELLQKGKQSLAMRRVQQAIANGTLKRLNRCQICDHEEKTVAHHYAGYDKPFSVWWICRTCNANLKAHDDSLTLEQAREHMKWIYIRSAEKRFAYKPYTPPDSVVEMFRFPLCVQCDEEPIIEFGTGGSMGWVRIRCPKCQEDSCGHSLEDAIEMWDLDMGFLQKVGDDFS